MRFNTQGVPDNLTDVLTKIYDFTLQRHQVLMANLASSSTPGFIPLDMPVGEFADIMDLAVAEHTRSKRLLFCDSQNVKFGMDTIFDARPVVDDEALAALNRNRNEFIEVQLKKLSENTLNQKLACELLKHKQGKLNILSTIL